MIEGKSFVFIIAIKNIYMIGGKCFLFIIINEKNVIEGKSFFIYYNKAHFITKRPGFHFANAVSNNQTIHAIFVYKRVF